MSSPTKAENQANNSYRGDDSEETGRERSNKPKTTSTKGKDLSHVPCKFFKVGSCTAGSACPFSHSTVESGQKGVCNYFVKGNCKFGHKCALAHILPGQSMSMDRKNRKAAQQQANASNQGRDGGRTKKSKSSGLNGNEGRNALLSGSTAPTRVLGNGSRPSPFKATISPSAPAPPVKDIDFTLSGLPDEDEELSSAPARGRSPSKGDAQGTTKGKDVDVVSEESKEITVETKSPSPPHVIIPSAPRRVAKPTSPKVNEFGAIGSTPTSVSPRNHGPLHNFSPGTSPSKGLGLLSSSPFSAPGHQTTFAPYDRTQDPLDFRSRAGLASSLGANKTFASEVLSSSQRPIVLRTDSLEGSAVEEQDLVPGSLTYLLTPEERFRRTSRSKVDGEGLQRPSEPHHHYSRSVPAPSLLSEIRSIWAEPGIAASPDQRTGLGGGLGNGTPSSFTSNSTFGGPALEDVLAPSNASAAFLPGMHRYLGNKGPPQRTALRPPSVLHPNPYSASNNPPLSYSAGLNGSALSPSRTSALSNQMYDLAHHEPYTTNDVSGRPIPGFRGEGREDENMIVSPSTRALQSHEPGQSLPQGLAAGYSRIHALPPTMSPTTPNAFSPPKSSGFGAIGSDWGDMSSSPRSGGNLDAAVTRLSYSSATSRISAGPYSTSNRIPSSRGFANGIGLLSPLSKPATADIDDLFNMEE
ncbi:hypothetical protein BDM02DRAFT_2750803 [Thelephora ganbajun]|uniref:Uncharacterized protein n=1 Tax=Thelephora ganbajun TaxID=370292 RepID=A0ACB6ZSE7_THEGA|nr:hypothetical protein BDM02DRAFT_2750803 [Thelephora ganbajun]